MGINGLLQGLKHLSTPGNISDFTGQSIAIDASSWLHKSVYSIADHYVEAVESNEIDARCIRVASDYMIKRCNELLSYARLKRIYMVLDGQRCPLKVVTNNERERKRQENLLAARKFRRAGDRDRMFEKYKACIRVHADLTAAVVQKLEQVYKNDKVRLVFAPFEADAQLVKLCIDRRADAVITEDSDVLVYAAACGVSFPILFKLDRNTGHCDTLSMDWLLSPSAVGSCNISGSSTLSGSNSSTTKKKRSTGIESVLEAYITREQRDKGRGARMFVQACVLAGCDYAPNTLHGVGLVNAFKMIKNAMHRESQERFRYVLSQLSSKARKQNDLVEYEELLAKSEAVFYYHPCANHHDMTDFLTNPFNDDAFSDAFRPLVDRFDGDLSFLGAHKATADNSTQGTNDNSRVSNDTYSVLSTPTVAGIREKVENPVKVTTDRRLDHGSKSTVDLPAVHRMMESEKATKRPVPTCVNPYQRKSARDNKTGDESSSKKPTNMFSQYAATNEKRKQTVFSPYKGDVRFVKRLFPVDGTRILLEDKETLPSHHSTEEGYERTPYHEHSQASVQPEIGVVSAPFDIYEPLGGYEHAHTPSHALHADHHDATYDDVDEEYNQRMLARRITMESNTQDSATLGYSSRSSQDILASSSQYSGTMPDVQFDYGHTESDEVEFLGVQDDTTPDSDRYITRVDRPISSRRSSSLYFGGGATPGGPTLGPAKVVRSRFHKMSLSSTQGSQDTNYFDGDNFSRSQSCSSSVISTGKKRVRRQSTLLGFLSQNKRQRPHT